MRSENETIHYRARFAVVPREGSGDALAALVDEMGRWCLEKEHALGRRDGVSTCDVSSHGLKTFSDELAEGRLSLPAGYEGGIGRRDGTSVCTASVSGEDGRLSSWAFEYDEPDGSLAFRHWHTSVGVSRRDSSDSCVINIRVSYYMMPGYIGRAPQVPPSTTPRFVHSIVSLDGYRVYVDETEVLPEEAYLDAGSFGVFVKSLLNPRRTLPLVLVTTDWNGATAVWDVTELAKKVLGMANVYVLDWRDQDLRRRCLFPLFRKGTPAYKFGCGMATLRVYQPGLNINDETDCSRHRFFKMSDIEAQRYGDHDGFVETLSRSLSRGFVTNEDDVIDVSDIRRKQVERRLSHLREKTEELRERVREARREREEHVPAATDGAELAYLRQELEKAQNEAREWEELAEAYSESASNEAEEALRARCAQLEADVVQRDDELRRGEFRIDSLQRECADLRARVTGGERTAKVVEQLRHVPTSLLDELELAERLWGDRMVVLDEARNSARNFTVGDLDEQWQILASVPTALWELYFGSAAGADIAARYQERTGYELALTEGKQSKATSGIMRERMVTYKGASVSILAHIKGRAKDPKRTFRLHYYVNREDRKIVIGHCGAHMTTAGTQKLR